MVGSCAGLAALVGTFDAAGGSLMGDWTKENTVADGLANLGHGADDHTAGESGMRQIREERRRRFFKVRRGAARRAAANTRAQRGCEPASERDF